MLTAMQHASFASKVAEFSPKDGKYSKDSANNKNGSFEGKQLPIATLVYMATLGGASVCNIEEETGSFATGKSFDAILVNLSRAVHSPYLPDDSTGDTLSQRLQRFIFCGDDRDLSKVWVGGKLVGGRDSQVV